MVSHLNRFSLARGYFEQMESDGGALLVSGWMMLPNRGLTGFRAYRDGELAGSAEPQIREDVGRAFPWIPHARRSGFQFRFPGTGRTGRIEVIGMRDRRPVARLQTMFRTDLDSAVPSPPAQVMVRVAGNASPAFFKADGMKSFTEFYDAICRHRALGSVRRMLDWGCGCGRVVVHFLLDGTVNEVFGCDIDDEAIAWCREHLQGGHYRRIDPYPPTPYADQSFELVIGYSVLTHLTRELQKAWLGEMRRVIAPGGLLVASVHGEFAASFAFPPTRFGGLMPRFWNRLNLRAILRQGIVDTMVDHALDGVAPEGYYRGVFQTREYTVREWSKLFEILEYIEGGAGNFQDLVVMRRAV